MGGTASSTTTYSGSRRTLAHVRTRHGQSPRVCVASEVCHRSLCFFRVRTHLLGWVDGVGFVPGVTSRPTVVSCSGLVCYCSPRCSTRTTAIYTGCIYPVRVCCCSSTICEIAYVRRTRDCFFMSSSVGAAVVRWAPSLPPSLCVSLQKPGNGASFCTSRPVASAPGVHSSETGLSFGLSLRETDWPPSPFSSLFYVPLLYEYVEATFIVFFTYVLRVLIITR